MNETYAFAGRAQAVIRQIPLLERSRPKALNYDVRLRRLHEHQEELLSGRRTEREGYRPLVPTDELPMEREAIPLKAEVTHLIPTGGVLNLDDVGAEVAEQRGDHWSGHHHPTVDHRQSGER